MGKAQEPVQGGHRAGGYDVGFEALHVLGARRMDLRNSGCFGGGLFQEAALFLDRFDQMNREARAVRKHDREDHSGEARAAAEIDDRCCVCGNQGHELRRVQNMATPDVGKGRGGDQIQVLISLNQKVNECG